MAWLADLQRVLTRKPDVSLHDRRQGGRKPCHVAVALFDESGRSDPATILDASEAGVRVACEREGVIEQARYLLRLDTGAAYRLRCVWRSPLEGGYELKGRVDGKPDGREPALEAIWNAWRTHVKSGLKTVAS